MYKLINKYYLLLAVLVFAAACAVSSNNTNNTNNTGTDSFLTDAQRSYIQEIIKADSIATGATSYQSLDKKPLFNGKSASTFPYWVQSNIKILNNSGTPSTAYVFLKFEISPEGSIENIKVLYSNYDKFSEEVIRVVKKSPSWTAGEKDGKPVRSYFQFKAVQHSK